MPGSGAEVLLSYSQENDLSAQLQHLTWCFTVGTRNYDVAMKVRWIYKEEFQLLLRLAGFSRWVLYGGFDKAPYEGEGEMVWIVEK